MKRTLACLLVLIIGSTNLPAQTIQIDTLKAGQNYKIAVELLDNGLDNEVDSALICAKNASTIYLKYQLWGKHLKSLCIQLQVFGKKLDEKQSLALFDSIARLSKEKLGQANEILAQAYHQKGLLYHRQSKIDSALVNYQKSIDIRRAISGELSAGIASTYHNIGIIYENIDEYDKALEYLLKDLEIVKKLEGDENVGVATSYQSIGNVYTNLGEYDKALEYHQKCLGIRTRILGEKHLDIARAYINIGNVYYNKMDFPKALDNYYKSLNMKIAILGEHHLEVSSSYINVGLVYNYMDQYDKALECFLKSLGIAKDLAGEQSDIMATIYNSIANAYYYKSQYDTALEYFNKSLSIFLSLYGENSSNTAKTYNNIGLVYMNKADYNKSLHYIKKSLSIFSGILPENHPNIATFYFTLGVLQGLRSNLDSALIYLNKSLEMRREILGEDHPDVAKSCFSIAQVYTEKGDYRKALDFQRRSLSIYFRTLGENHTWVADSYNNIGNTYTYMAEYDKALEYYNKTLKIYSDLVDANSKDFAIAYTNIGNIYSFKGEYDRALIYLQKALQLYREIFGEQHPEVAMVLSNIATDLVEKGQFDEALGYYLKSLDIKIKTIGEAHIDVAQTYLGIGQLFSKKKEYAKAMEYLQKALSIWRKNFGDNHPDVARTYGEIAGIYSRLSQNDVSKRELALKYYHYGILASIKGQHDSTHLYTLPPLQNNTEYSILLQNINGKALTLSRSEATLTHAMQHYLVADSIINVYRRNISNEEDRLALASTANQIYTGAISVCTRLANRSPSNGKSKMLNKAYYFSEQCKAMVLLEALGGLEGIEHAGIPDSLIRKEQNLKLDIAYYQKKLEEGVDSALTLKFQSGLFNCNRQYEDLISNLEKNYPNYYNLKYSNKQPKINDIQKRLDNATALRSYFLGDSSLYLFTITKNNLTIREGEGITGLEDSIQVFRSSLAGDPKYSNRYLSSGSYLYQKLFPDINDLDKRIENLVIIPDGSLAFVPFESLPMADYSPIQGETAQTVDSLRGFKSLTTSIGSGNMKDFPFLIKRFNISYAYSATLYYQTCMAESKSKSQKDKLSWMAIAPVFSDRESKKATLETIELQRRMRFYCSDTLSTRGTLLSGEYVVPLPGTESETGSILGEFKAKKLNAKVLLKDEATEKTIKSGVLENYRILHFATHGFVNSEKPELSGILLAQDSTGGQDGILYSGELYNLKLNADLTVLSACETGLGKIRKGEGIIGLTRALLYAGSKNIIVSLWPVSDNSTSALMIDFYKNLLNGKKRESYSQWLREAKLKMIEEGKYSNPFYWSPFILVGK